MKLQKALLLLIRRLGNDVLQENHLVDLLSDCQAFDDYPAMKQVMSAIFEGVYGKEIYSRILCRNKTDYQLYNNYLKDSLIKAHGFKPAFVDYSIDCISYALGLQDSVREPDDHSSNPLLSILDSVNGQADIQENNLLKENHDVLSLLLLDQTTKNNIFWATDNYVHFGDGYRWNDEITIDSITGDHGDIIQPRILKNQKVQQKRSKDMAEVFTPCWICNSQNNMADEKWFGRKNVFNYENENHTWTPVDGRISFPSDSRRTWQHYVEALVLEVTCGEGPYLVSRYDTVMGDLIPVNRRIGLLDRKLRIVGENTSLKKDWLDWAKKALMSTYGYEWQGDNLLLARESIFYTFIDYYQSKFHEMPPKDEMCGIAEIISWNIWQMDGLKGVIPGSCHDGEKKIVEDLFGQTELTVNCPGCRNGDLMCHEGIYCRIRDWQVNGVGQEKRFVELINPWC